MILAIILCGLSVEASIIKMGVLLSGSGWETGNLTLPGVELAIKEIKEWDESIDIELKVEIDGCREEQSYGAAHNLLKWGAKVIIGPACTICCGPVSLMAKEYGVPVISPACSGTGLSDREIYPNFARTAEADSGASKLLKKIFKEFEFELFSVMTTTQSINVNLAIDFITEMRQVKDSEGDPYKMKQLSTAVSNLEDRDEAVQDGTVDQLSSLIAGSWVFVLFMYDHDRNFILKNSAEKAAEIHGVKVEEVWEKTNYAWFSSQASVAKGMEIYYENVFTLENDRPIVTYASSYKTFMDKFDNPKKLFEDKNDNFPLYLAYAYNAVIAWATAYNKVKNVTYTDMMPALKNLNFPGAYREEQLDDNAEPANPIWNLKQYQSGQYVEVVTQSLTDINKINIFYDKIKWPNGKIVDPCQDDRCSIAEDSNTILYAVVGVCLVLVISVIVVAMYLVHRNKVKSEEDKKIAWRISFSELDFTVKKNIGGSRRFVPDEPVASKHSSVAKYGHSHVVVKNLDLQSLIVSKEVLDDLFLLKKVVHPNLALFYGLCDEPGYCSVITEYCSKGPLKDIIHDENVQLDWMFKLSLISDIAKGIKHLHQSNFGYHGNLSSSLCVVDSHWVCKLTDFGMHNIFKDKSEVIQNNMAQSNKKTANAKDLFYTAPEKLWPCSKARTTKEMQKCDTYSFSMVMYELFAREEVYDTSEMSAEKIVQKVRNRLSPPLRPNIELLQITERTSYEQVEMEDSLNIIPAEALKLMKQCWMEMPFERNNMSDTVQALEDMNPDRSLSITDRVVKMMEKYSEDLENKVALKTQELQNQQSDKKLCCRYLPQKVIERIEEGLEVENVVDTEITAVCVRVKILEDRNQVAVVNSFEAFNSREIEPRNIYQVVNNNGLPMVVSGLYNTEDATDQILEYVSALQSFVAQNKMLLKVVIHAGRASAGLLSTDSSNPRLCVTGEIVDDTQTLLEQIDFEQTILSEKMISFLPKDILTKSHKAVKLCNNKIVDTFLIDLAVHHSERDLLQPTSSLQPAEFV